MKECRAGSRWGWVMIMLLASVIVFPLSADATDFPFQRGTMEVGLRSGYNIGADRNADMIPVSLRLGYVLYSGKYKFLPRGALEVATEPFVSPITSVESGKDGSIEMGLALPMFTYHFDIGNHIVPYIEGGVGVMYTDLRGYRLGSHFQFLSQGGAGLSYFLTDNTALNLSWRFRHISNASLYDDNRGFNSYIFQAGFSYFLPLH